MRGRVQKSKHRSWRGSLPHPLRAPAYYTTDDEVNRCEPIDARRSIQPGTHSNTTARFSSRDPIFMYICSMDHLGLNAEGRARGKGIATCLQSFLLPLFTMVKHPREDTGAIDSRRSSTLRPFTFSPLEIAVKPRHHDDGGSSAHRCAFEDSRVLYFIEGSEYRLPGTCEEYEIGGMIVFSQYLARHRNVVRCGRNRSCTLIQTIKTSSQAQGLSPRTTPPRWDI